MDDSLQNLENELKALRPRRPSALLRARVEHELSRDAAAPAADMPAPVIRTAVDAKAAPRYATATTLRSWKWFSWQMAAAAGVALVVSLGVWRAMAPSIPDDFPADPAGARQPGVAANDVPAAEASGAEPAPRALANRAAPNAFQPVKAANVLYDVRDEGLVMLEDNTHGRAVRARYVDTYTWKNPATNASIKWSVPRDEVRVLPASFH